MELGMIGLGRMGSNMVCRLIRAGHHSVVYNIHPEAVQAIAQDGAIGATSFEDFAGKLKSPRTVRMMVPAAAVDATLKTLVPFFEHDDAIFELKTKGIHYVDAGTIAEVWRRGSASWVPDRAAASLPDSPDLAKFADRVSDSGEGRWTIALHLDEPVPAPVLSALRHQFGAVTKAAA